MHKSDYELINEFLHGDKNSFEKIIEKYEKLVYRICFRFMRNAEDAEDMSQEVFIIIYKKLHMFNFKSSLQTWIYRICVNSCLTRLKALDKKEYFNDEKFTDRACNPIELIEITDEKDFLLSELDKLNNKTRLVARLRLIGNKSFAEIANILHIPVSTARTNFKRTRDHLKSKLEDYRKL